MSQLNAQQAAQLGSQLTGLPAAFVAALIAEEGTLQGTGGGSNNPFDVTQTWANDAGYGSNVSGQWNSVGVATFNDTTAAVNAWAYGINNFSLYAPVRAALASGTSDFGTLANSFPSAYSGGSSTWAGNVVSLANQAVDAGYSSLTGSINSLATGTTPAPSAGLPPAGAPTLIPGVSLPSITIPGASDIPGAITGVGQGISQTIQQITSPITSLVGNLTSIISFLDQPQVWVGVVMTAVGVLITLVGVVLFGLSLVPKQDATALAAVVAA